MPSPVLSVVRIWVAENREQEAIELALDPEDCRIFNFELVENEPDGPSLWKLEFLGWSARRPRTRSGLTSEQAYEKDARSRAAGSSYGAAVGAPSTDWAKVQIGLLQSVLGRMAITEEPEQRSQYQLLVIHPGALVGRQSLLE